jgi:hypothetical protein
LFSVEVSDKFFVPSKLAVHAEVGFIELSRQQRELLCGNCTIVDRLCVPSESQRPANKRRKRKGSQSGGAANNAPPAPNKKRSPGPNFSLASQVSTNPSKVQVMQNRIL